MENEKIEKLKYPLGKWKAPAVIDSVVLKEYINTIESFPISLQKAVKNMSDEQLDTPYREEGWSIQQVVHHCADSHMNSLIRLKLALTENAPTIKPYREELWADLADSKKMDVKASLQIIEGVHARWVAVLKSLSETQFDRTFIHPESKRTFSLRESTSLYAWHCEHHLAHINTLKQNKGW